MNEDDFPIINHIYKKTDNHEIGFILSSNKNFVYIETIDEKDKRFNITLSLNDFLTIAETLKTASGG